MEASSRSTRWTYAEFARLPSEGSTRHEVIAGELVVTPAPSKRHQRVATDLVTWLNGFVREHELGEVFAGPIDVLFGEGDYLEPDVLFVRKDRLDIVSDRGVEEAAPDLVVEILSPATAARDRGTKLDRCRHFGVPEYWVVDPDAPSIEVWRFAEGAAEPAVFGPGDTLRWEPGPGKAVLDLSVHALTEET